MFSSRSRRVERVRHSRSGVLVCFAYMSISTQSSLAEAYFESRLCAEKASEESSAERS